MSAPNTRRMLALLEQERRALHEADLAQLARLMPRKVALLERLEREPVDDAVSLAQVRDAAQRNAGLLRALIDGVGAARRLIADLQTGAQGSTYRPDGVRARLDPKAGSLQRRA